MEHPNNDLLNEFDGSHKPHVYGTFWERFFALLIDGLIVGVVTVPITRFNDVSSKSYSILIILAILSFLYKPMLEFKYGATVGKMAMKLLVVNTEFHPINLKEALTRDIFGIFIKIFSVTVSLIIFAHSGFEDIITHKQYAGFSSSIIKPYWLVGPYIIITIVDAIFLLTDKQNRSLHDKIGATIVIKK